jgi:hypothetical protein
VPTHQLTGRRLADPTHLATAFLAELFDQCQGRGLTHHGGASSDTGKQTIVVAGSIDLIALARRALATMEAIRARPARRLGRRTAR